MKLRSFIFAAVTAVMAFAACEQKEDLGTPNITLSVNELNFDQGIGEQTLTVTATRDWSVEVEDSWVVVSPDAGEASSQPQTVSVTVLKNEGYNRSVDLKFTIGTKSKYLTVNQAGNLGSADALVVYSNDFDITKADTKPELNGNYSVWDNKQGTGASTVTYAFGGKVSARVTGKLSNNTEGYSHYSGSGSNKVFFGTGTSTLKIQHITLGNNVDYTLSFGAQKYLQDGDSNFSWDEFKVYVSNDTQKWVQVNAVFPEGADINGDWNQAVANITLPANTAELSIAFQSTCASAYSLDDVKLAVGTSAGQVIDFTAGVELSGTSEGSSGSSSDDNTGDLPEGTGEGTQASPYNAAKAQRVAAALSDSETKTGVYVKGIVKEIKELSTQYGNATYWITDEDGIAKFYVYRGKNVGNASFTSADELSVGDQVVIYGDLMNYMGNSPQLGQGNYLISNSSNGNGGTTEPSDPVEQPTTLVTATIAQFLAAAEDDTWYQLTGEIVSIVAGNKYGNFTIKDDTGSVYIYGMTSRWVGSNDQSFESRGLKETDIVTLGTRRTSNPNNGVAQGGGNTIPAYYISHVPGAGLPEDPAETVELTFPSGNQSSVNSYTSTWDVVLGSNTWSITNFNNNQNKWSYIKCGHKSTSNVATIATTNAYAAAIKKVVVSVDQLLDASKVTAKLEVATDAAFSNITETVNVTLAAGPVDYVITTPTANCYYRLTFDNVALGGSSNGNVQISKVKYIPAN